MADFTHLHVHSHFSLLDGLGKINPLLKRARELGMDSMALTDHGAMYGTIQFVRTAKALGIKPIIGVEAYLAPEGHQQRNSRPGTGGSRHITLLAQNKEGYHNLIELTTVAHRQGYYYKPRIDYELLAKHSQGIVALSGCLNGDIARAVVERRHEDARRLIQWHEDVFGKERFYLEVQDHPAINEQKTVNDALIKYSRRYSLNLVATSDIHYIHSEDAEAHDVLLCVQTGKVVQDKGRLCMLGEDFSMHSPQQMKEAWKEYPSAIDNTQKIAAMCNVDLEFGINRLPHYPLPPKTSPLQALRGKCQRRLEQRYKSPNIRPQAQERLDYELSVIEKTGFASYFLIVADFVNEAKRRGILVGPGRGSAAGSIVSYLTNVTGLDPLRYNLLFERFLNPDRISMPDIDLDFADDRRDEIIDYVREKYGHEHVAQIITFGTMAARASVRDAGRALGFPYSFCDRIAKTVPPLIGFDQALKQSTELKEMYREDPQAKRLIDTARKLEGVCRHASTHAAGVVITEEPLTRHVPLQLATSREARQVVVTQYPMDDVEALGLLKIDFLGLKNLTIIQDTIKRIKYRHGQTIDIEQLPLDDKATYRLLQEGKTTGVFQLESSGMKRWLRELKPTELEDIISMVALYRPGPMDSIPDFVAAKQGRRRIVYLHPVLKPILEKTYGVIVTQDQVLQIAREFAGFTYAEADILRKAVGKKIKKLLNEQRDKFIRGAINNRKVDRKTAQKVWDFIEPFARYGFNRAHAACYAVIAYQTAYLKANYPAEFMAALLTSEEGNVDRQAVAVGEALNMDLKVLPPDVNESGRNFTVVTDKDGKETVRFGLGAVKNVGHNVVAALIKERSNNGKYQDLLDIFRRIKNKDFNRKSVESLARAGAFDRLAERNYLLENLERLLNFNRSLHKKIDLGQQGLFGNEANSLAPPRINLDQVAPAGQEDRLAWEKELLGMYVSEHPWRELAAPLASVAMPLSELKEMPPSEEKRRVRVGGIVSRITRITTKSQQSMLFVQIEDMAGKAEVLVFPSLLAKTAAVWNDGARVLVEGSLSRKEGEVKVLADRVWTVDPSSLPALTKSLPSLKKYRPQDLSFRSAHQLVIHLNSSMSRQQLEKLRTILAQRHKKEASGLPVELRVRQGTQEVKTIPTNFRLPREESAVEILKNIVGERSISYR